MFDRSSLTGKKTNFEVVSFKCDNKFQFGDCVGRVVISKYFDIVSEDGFSDHFLNDDAVIVSAVFCPVTSLEKLKETSIMGIKVNKVTTMTVSLVKPYRTNALSG